MEFESKSLVHTQNRLIPPEDVARLPTGVVWSETNTCANNTFTPINLSTRETGRPRVSSQSKILMSDTLPSIKEALGVESFEYLCANPLKRRLLNDVHVHEEQDARMISSRSLISMASIPVSLRKFCAEDGNDEDDFTDDASLDDGNESSYSDSYFDSNSDAILELDISSDCSTLSSDAHKTQHSKRAKDLRAQKEDKIHTKKRKTTKRLSRTKLKQVVSPFSPPPTALLSSSSASPISVKHQQQHRKKKKHSRPDDLTAAETLLALRSGSSTLSENESEDGRVSAKNAKKRTRYPQQQKQRKVAVVRGGLERFSLAVNSQSDLIERMAKRLRRASF